MLRERIYGHTVDIWEVLWVPSVAGSIYYDIHLSTVPNDRSTALAEQVNDEHAASLETERVSRHL